MLTITGISSFDYFFSIFIYFFISILPLLFLLVLITRKW